MYIKRVRRFNLLQSFAQCMKDLKNKIYYFLNCKKKIFSTKKNWLKQKKKIRFKICIIIFTVGLKLLSAVTSYFHCNNKLADFQPLPNLYSVVLTKLRIKKFLIYFEYYDR